MTQVLQPATVLLVVVIVVLVLVDVEVFVDITPCIPVPTSDPVPLHMKRKLWPVVCPNQSGSTSFAQRRTRNSDLREKR